MLDMRSNIVHRILNIIILFSLLNTYFYTICGVNLLRGEAEFVLEAGGMKSTRKKSKRIPNLEGLLTIYHARVKAGPPIGEVSLKAESQSFQTGSRP